jgi:hypothetical protein
VNEGAPRRSDEARRAALLLMGAGVVLLGLAVVLGWLP